MNKRKITHGLKQMQTERHFNFLISRVLPGWNLCLISFWKGKWALFWIGLGEENNHCPNIPVTEGATQQCTAFALGSFTHMRFRYYLTTFFLFLISILEIKISFPLEKRNWYLLRACRILGMLFIALFNIHRSSGQSVIKLSQRWRHLENLTHLSKSCSF